MRSLAVPLAALLAAGAAGCSSRGAPSGSAPAEGEAADVFRDRTDQELDAALSAARDQARREDKRVLLEFVAPWCVDCREVSRVAQQEPAASVLREKYVVVPVNVGRFDRHKALLREHGVQVIAALVVLDADGKRVAKTTLEPITKRAALTAEELAAWLRAPAGT